MLFRALLSWRPQESAENKIFVALIATVAVGGGQGVLNSFDVFGSKAVAELLAFLACMWLFPREPRIDWSIWLMPLLVGLGCVGGGLWILFIGYPARSETEFVPLSKIPVAFYVLGVVTSCVVTPLFEEKVVRHLLLSGVSNYVGKIGGTVAVSVVFALVHIDSMVSAFFYSITLCAGVYIFRLNTVQRAVIHGVINFVIMHWVLLYPSL